MAHSNNIGDEPSTTPSTQEGDATPYSDTTQSILDVALDNLANEFSPDVVQRLRSLTETRKLADPDAVLAALSSPEEPVNAAD